MALSWSRQLRDLLECVLLPAALAVLPAPFALAAARALSRTGVYAEYVSGFVEGAARHGRAPDAVALARRRRFYVLIDHVDLYWSWWRSERFFRRLVEVRGRWPDDGRPFVVVFFHWGNGLLGIRDLGSRGFAAHLIGRPVDEVQLRHRPLQRWYVRARYAAAAACGRADVVYWGGAKARILAALQTPRRTVLGAVDVPPTEIHSLTPVRFLGHRSAFTHGLVKLAREHGARLVPMHLGFDAALRRRTLEIDAPIDPAAQPLEATMQQLADRIGAKIDADPGAWWLWAWVDQFFVHTDPAAPLARPAAEPA